MYYIYFWLDCVGTRLMVAIYALIIMLAIIYILWFNNVEPDSMYGDFGDDFEEWIDDQ